MRLALSVVALALSVAAPVRAAPGEVGIAPPGAQTCVSCHGPAAKVPAIAGRPAAEIEAAMAQFRDGSRPATIMNRLAKGFSADETHAIAEWLANSGEGR